MTFRSLRIFTLAVIALTPAVAGRAQLTTPTQDPVSLAGTFVNLYFNSTGDLIQYMPDGNGGFTKIGDGNGIKFRSESNDPQKLEMISWDSHAAESWGLNYTVNGNTIRNTNGFFGSELAADVYKPTITDATHASFKMDLYDESIVAGGSKALQLTQNVHYNLDDKLVVFDVTIKNTTSSVISDLFYIRSVNPKQGFPFSIQDTTNNLGSPFYNDGIAVDSKIRGLSENSANQRHLAIGSPIVGTRVNSGGNAEFNTDADLSLIESGFIQGNKAAWAELTGFTNGVPDILSVGDPNNFQSGQVALNLWKGLGELAPGQSVDYTFIYVFGGPAQPSTTVPEPGMISALAAIILSGGIVLRRKRSS